MTKKSTSVNIDIKRFCPCENVKSIAWSINSIKRSFNFLCSQCKKESDILWDDVGFYIHIDRLTIVAPQDKMESAVEEEFSNLISFRSKPSELIH